MECSRRKFTKNDCCFICQILFISIEKRVMFLVFPNDLDLFLERQAESLSSSHNMHSLPMSNDLQKQVRSNKLLKFIHSPQNLSNFGMLTTSKWNKKLWLMSSSSRFLSLSNIFTSICVNLLREKSMTRRFELFANRLRLNSVTLFLLIPKYFNLVQDDNAQCYIRLREHWVKTRPVISKKVLQISDVRIGIIEFFKFIVSTNKLRGCDGSKKGQVSFVLISSKSHEPYSASSSQSMASQTIRYELMKIYKKRF